MKLFILIFIFFKPIMIFSASLSSSFPDSSLKPQEVVNIQLLAMKNNDDSNEGIEITFRFASPRNKMNTGPIERFVKLVNSPSYRGLLNHIDSEFISLKITNGIAIQDVIITTKYKKRTGFRFQLSIQKNSKYKDCWMTDSVIPFKVPEISA